MSDPKLPGDPVSAVGYVVGIVIGALLSTAVVLGLCAAVVLLARFVSGLI